MDYKKQSLKAFSVLLIIWSFLINSLPTKAQDIPPTDELSLGSSVFLSRKTAPKKFISRGPSRVVKREKTQVVASVKKITKQYNTLAKVTTRRAKVKVVAPEDVPMDLARIPPQEASIILTGLGQYRYNRDEFDLSIDAYRNSIRLDAKNMNAKLGLSDALTSKAAQLFEDDKTPDAKGLFEEALTFNNENSAAFAGLGEFYDATGDDKQSRANAINNYEKALQIDKDLTEVFAPIGILYYKQGEIAKADNYLTKALASHPNDAETQYFLGLIRYSQTRYKDSDTSFRQAINLFEKSPNANKLSENIAQVHFNLGENNVRRNLPDDALDEYKKAADLNPKYVEAQFEIGFINYNLGKYADAVTAYEKVKMLKNDNWENYANLGDAYRKLGKYNEAEGAYRIATQFIKDDAELYSSYGFVLGAQNKWNGAISELNKAINLSPNVLDYTNLGWAYYNSAQADLKANRKPEAIEKLKSGKESLQKAVASNPDFAPPYLNLGITLTDLGEYQESVNILKHAVGLRKDWLDANNELGLAYRNLNDFDNAAKQFQKTIEIDKNYAAGYYNLGEVELQRGNTKAAENAQEKLKKLNPAFANALRIKIINGKSKGKK